MRLTRVAICLLLLPAAAAASSPDPLEEMFNDIEEEEDYIDLLNALDTTVKQPANLLEASRQELMSLPWVSPWLATGIVRLRQTGDLRSVDDLKKIQGVSDRLVDLLRPFVVVVPVRRRPSRIKGLVRMRLVASPASSSFRNQKAYLRAESEYSGLGAGLVMEKDRLERKPNDFSAYYLTQRWSWGRVVLGDFALTSGHGLIFSDAYGYSPSTVSPWRYGQGGSGVRPYTSVEENSALRGAGLEVKRGGLLLWFAGSVAEFDAVLDDTGRVKSLRASGYHTTDAERRGRDALEENLVAVAGRYARSPVVLDAAAAYTGFNRSFAVGRLGTLKKNDNLMGSLDVGLHDEERSLFFQIATAGEAEAALAGAAWAKPRADLLVLARSYGQGFVSLHGRPFAFYSGLASGERGVFTQLTLKPTPNGQVSVGSDLHERRDDPEGLPTVSGSESFLTAEIDAGDVGLAIGEKLLRGTEPPSSEGDLTKDRSRLRSRVDVRYDVTRRLAIRARYENLHSTEDVGGAVTRAASDLVRLDIGLDVGARIALKAGFYTFSVQDYASRLYQYEPGLPYYPDLEMLGADGSRWFAAISFRDETFGQVAAKAGRTDYDYDSDKFELLLYYSLRI